MKQSFKIAVLALCMIPAACLEPQIAPDLTKTPLGDFTVDVIATELKNPWSVAALGEDTYLITERGGKLFLIESDQKTEVVGLPNDIYVEGQAGLFDIVLSPDFMQSARVYISYAGGTAEANSTTVLSAKLEGGQLTEVKTIFRASPSKDTNAHFGGRMVFLDDGTLILTTGEGFKYREASQDLNSHLGKTIRLDQDGGVLQSNPKLGDKKQVYSYGHRNPQGLAYDAATNMLWSHEHGPRGGDELNLIKPGANYGWPIATQGTDYNGAKISPHKSYEGMEDAVHAWTPSIAASGLAIYRGDMFPAWRGDALIGGLVSKDLRRVDLENGVSVGEEVLLSDLGQRVRDVRIDDDGAILILTDSDKGQLLRITPKTEAK